CIFVSGNEPRWQIHFGRLRLRLAGGRSMRLQRQTLALGALGVVDLFTTLAFIHFHGAAEANPLMAAFLSQGILAFLAAKLGLLIGPLSILEWARRFNPIFVTRAVNAAMIAYVCFYAVGVARVNAEP